MWIIKIPGSRHLHIENQKLHVLDKYVIDIGTLENCESIRIWIDLYKSELFVGGFNWIWNEIMNLEWSTFDIVNKM